MNIQYSSDTIDVKHKYFPNAISSSTNKLIAMAIGDRIKFARQRKGFQSKAELARRLGISASSVVQWERPSDGTSPSVENLAKLAVVLGVNFEWLATGRGPMVYTQPQEDFRDIHQIRRDNLDAALAELTEEAVKGLLAGTGIGQLPPAQWQKVNYDVDDNLARKVERMIGKPYGWMDHPNTNAISEDRTHYAEEVLDKDLTELATKFAELILTVPEGRLREASRLIDKLVDDEPAVDPSASSAARPKPPARKLRLRQAPKKSGNTAATNDSNTE